MMMQQSQSDAVAATLTSLRLLFACRRCLCACVGSGGAGGPAELLLDRLQEIFSSATDRLQRLADDARLLRGSSGAQLPGAASAKRAAAGLVPPLCLKRELLHLLRRSMLRCGSGNADHLLTDFGDNLDRLLPDRAGVGQDPDNDGDDEDEEEFEDDLSAFSETSCLSGGGGGGGARNSLAEQLAELRIGLDACLVVTSLLAERGSSGCARVGSVCGNCSGGGSGGVCSCCVRWSARVTDLEAEAAQLRASRAALQGPAGRGALTTELQQLTDDLRRLVSGSTRRAMPLPPPPPLPLLPPPQQQPPPIPPRPQRRRHQQVWFRDYTDV